MDKSSFAHLEGFARRAVRLVMHRIAFALFLATLSTGCAHALDPVPVDDAPDAGAMSAPDAAPVPSAPAPDAGPMPPRQDDSGQGPDVATADASPDAIDAAGDVLDAGQASHANDPIVASDAGKTVIDGMGDYTMRIEPDAGRQFVGDAGPGYSVATGADGNLYLCEPPDAPANTANCQLINGAVAVYCAWAGCEPVYPCTVGEYCGVGAARTLYCPTNPPPNQEFIIELPDGGGLYGSGAVAKPPVGWHCYQGCCLPG